jgi:lipopolysaccharide export system protein LptA
MAMLAFQFLASVSNAQDKTIELIQADVTEYDVDFIDAERVKGNVRFKQDNVYMDCDSAYFYRKENKINAFGNIYIRQEDTLNLWGDYLEYDGDTKMAYVKENVRLEDQQMELQSDLVHYDMNSKTAFYTTGGKIKNDKDRLTSRIGRYNSRSKEFFFKDSVVLINPEYTIKSDTLQYNTFSKIATFHGPTYITSEENTIFCRYGWYDTKNNTSQFSKGAWIQGKENKLIADSMLYNRNTEVGRAFNNITLIDTIERIKIRGSYGIYHRLKRRTLVSGNPLAIKYIDDDSLFLKADTLIDEKDTNDVRKLSAFHHTMIHKSDMQGISDSLVYSFTDSTIHMFGLPVIWTEENQITGDTLIIYRRNGELDQMDALHDAFIASEETEGIYNQISGRNMNSYFKNNKLNRVHVYGNGQSVYYAKENDTSYTGVNHIICSDMLINVDSNKVDGITFYGKPEGGFYPVDQLPLEKSVLPNLNWQSEKRPVLKWFIDQKQSQEDDLPDTVIDLLDKTYEDVETIDLK